MPTPPLPAALVAFLGRPNVATLVTLGPDGAPQATVVWFLWEDGRLLVNSRAGRVKARNLARDPRVALTVVDGADPYRSLHLQGRVVRTVTGAAARDDIDRLSRHYTGEPFRVDEPRVSWWIAPTRWAQWGLLPGPP